MTQLSFDRRLAQATEKQNSACFAPYSVLRTPYSTYLVHMDLQTLGNQLEEDQSLKAGRGRDFEAPYGDNTDSDQECFSHLMI